MKKFAVPVVLLLMIVALQGAKYGSRYAGITTNSVTAGVIIEETSMRSKLPIDVLEALLSAPKYGIEVVDKDIVDRDKNPPKELAPFLNAADKSNLPQLVVERNTRYESIPLKSLDQVRKIVK